MNRTIKIVTAGLAVAAMSLGGAALAQADTGTLDDAESSGLTYLREEEKLAHDLYTQFGELHDSVVWDRIAASEQRHFDAVGRLLDLYEIDDPAGGEVGVFVDAGIQALYDSWLADGEASEDAAFAAAIELEEADIADLETDIAANDEEDIEAVLESLLRGSERHLATFTRWADGEAVVGEPPEWAGQGNGGAGSDSALCDGTGAQDRVAAQDGSGDSYGPGAMGQRGRRGGGMGGMDGSGNENAPRRAVAES